MKNVKTPITNSETTEINEDGSASYMDTSKHYHLHDLYCTNCEWNGGAYFNQGTAWKDYHCPQCECQSLVRRHEATVDCFCSIGQNHKVQTPAEMFEGFV